MRVSVHLVIIVSTSIEQMDNLSTNRTARLHCLDWLRVIAIAMLIVYHTAMVYVPDWGYHYKNPLSSDWIKSLMLLTSPWRMGLLWLVSGIALAYMCKKQQILSLIIKRSNQILLPLLVGVLFVVPIQLFAQMKQAGDMPLDLWGFMYAFYLNPQQSFINYSSGIWPRFDVNHLWFLRSLWRFSIVIILLTPLLNTKLANRVFGFVSVRISMLVVIVFVPIGLIQWLLEGESVREYYGFTLLFLGFTLGLQLGFWQTLIKHITWICIASVLAMIALQIGFIQIWQSGLNETNSALNFLIEVIYLLNKVLPLLAILGLSYLYLNKPNQVINKLNPYVFPIYILHQSVIIGIAYFASTSGFVFIQKAEYQVWFNIVLSPLICAILLMIIARINVLRVGFGMRLKGNKDPYQYWQYSVIALLLCAPMIYRLL
jgi:hypothetical protein